MVALYWRSIVRLYGLYFTDTEGSRRYLICSGVEFSFFFVSCRDLNLAREEMDFSAPNFSVDEIFMICGFHASFIFLIYCDPLKRSIELGYGVFFGGDAPPPPKKKYESPLQRNF